MQVSDIVRRVRDAAGDTAVLQFTNATLTDWINDGIRECVIENSLLQAKATSSTVIGQTDYSLPTNIFKLHSVWVDGYKLEVLTLEQWEERNAGTHGASTPEGATLACYVYAGVLTIWPEPDSVKTLQINYTKHPTSITYDSDLGTWSSQDLSIPEQFHNRIVTYCLAQVAMQDDDYAKYEALMVEFRTGVAEIKHSTQAEDDLYPFISVSSRDMGDVDLSGF